MDIILVTVTLISLAIAGALAVLLARKVRDERRRADARVALLMDLAASNEPRTQAASRFDLELRPSTVTPAVGNLFDEHQEESAWPRRVLAAGAVAVLVGGVVLTWSAIDRRASVVAPPATTSAAMQPLELLSLAHQQQAGTLIVSGLIQNLRSASALTGVQATVLVFGTDGALLATGRAPLDFTTLAPGDESPFVIRLPVTGAARYRVGFRGAHDETLAHVDRRNSPLARKDAP
jgi:hypothetical protein